MEIFPVYIYVANFVYFANIQMKLVSKAGSS